MPGEEVRRAFDLRGSRTRLNQIVPDADQRYPRHLVYTAHQRELAASANSVGQLIDSLASKNDRLWPRSEWQAMRLNGPLAVSAAGGHGSVRYFVTAYETGRLIKFQVTGPPGFNGHHAFTATKITDNSALLRHELSMS